MGTVYKRKSTWWIAFTVPGGQRVWRSTGIPASEPEIEARRLLENTEKNLAAQVKVAGSASTLAEYALTWTAERKGAKQTNAQRDFDRLELHVFPKFGGRRLTSISTLEIRKLVASLRASTLAPRTVRNIYGLLHRLFEDATAEELVTSNPCVLKRRDLPKKRDKNPEWRDGAVFSREEAELLLSSPLIPLDRKVTYALGLCGGLREGEVSAVRVGALKRERVPMPRLLITESYTRHNGYVKSTKTGQPRQVPVHPVLERILDEWLSSGFASQFGREPLPGDLLVPNRHGGYRTDNSFMKGIVRDLAALGGLRHRRFHDTRRTFISLGRTDGANPAVLKSVTHDQVGDVFDQYTTFTLEAKCEAVFCLKLTGRALARVTVAAAAGAESVTLGVTPESPSSQPSIALEELVPFLAGMSGTRTRTPCGTRS